MQTKNVINHKVILNLIQDLPRLPLPLLNNLQSRCQDPVLKHYGAGKKEIFRFGMTALFDKGFTLIELLVVVVIISVLTAIALPQYKLAVVKSQFAKIRPVVFALQQAEETYYLSNGSYTKLVDNLDLNHTCTTVFSQGDVFACDNNFFVDVLESNEPKISIYYCPNLSVTTDSWQQCWSQNKLFKYEIWLNHSNTPNTATCTSFSNLGTKFCNTLAL